VADTFAAILPFAAEAAASPGERRALGQLLYHTGRWIYLIDAYDDLEQDKRTGDFNPLLMRFHASETGLSEEDRAWLETTLSHSVNLATSAYNLLPQGAWRGILENIIYLGLPVATDSVLRGRFRRRWGRWERRDGRRE